MTSIDLIEIVVGVLMVAFAFISIHARKSISAIIFLSLISLLAVVAFVMMKAPDVAITEAVIGSGLVTALFVFTLFARKNGGQEK
jgi:energy-converting hydrogenase B subunit D